MCKILCFAVLTLLVCLVQFAGAATKATIGFTPHGLSSWDVFLRISPDAPNQIVSAYNLDIRYDPLILSPNQVTFSSNLGSATSFEVLQDYSLTKSGVVNIAAVSLLADADLQTLQGTGVREITLATLMFNNPSSQSTSLTADWSTTTGLRDVKGLNNMVISEMNTVPEPSTYILTGIAGAALLTAAWFQRRKVEVA